MNQTVYFPIILTCLTPLLVLSLKFCCIASNSVRCYAIDELMYEIKVRLQYTGECDQDP